MEQLLLSNPAQENVTVEQNKWVDRVQYLDEEVIQLGQEEKQLQQEIKDSENRTETLRVDLSRATKERDEILFTQNKLDESQTRLIKKLVGLRPQWAAFDSIYVKQPTIEARLQEDLKRMRNERNEWLSQERLAYRFVDDYQDQDVFFADPYLEEQLKGWKNQFDFVTTGVEFLQQLSEEEKAMKRQYPLWPLTLITTAKSKQVLIDKVATIRKNLQFPISIINLEEASDLNGMSSSSLWISPVHWSDNVHPAQFNSWKESIIERATAVTRKREEKEFEVKQREDIWKELQQFLMDYPAELEKQLKEDGSRLSHEIESLIRSTEKEKQFVVECRNKIKSIQSKVNIFSSEMQGLNDKIEKAHQFLNYEKEIVMLKEKSLNLRNAIQTYEKNSGQLTRQIDSFQDEKDELVGRQSDLTQRINIMKEDEEYKELQTLSPLYTSEGKKVIQERIKELDYKIRKISTTRGEWEAKLRAEKDILSRIQTDLELLRKEYEDINETLDFPSDGERFIQSTWEKMKELEGLFKNLQLEVSRKKSAVDTQSGIWSNSLKRFRDHFPNDKQISFSESIPEIEAMLQTEEKILLERLSYLNQEQSRVGKELQSIEVAERELEKFVEGHHFNSPDIVAETLDVDEVRTFTYNRKGFVQDVTGSLKTCKDNVLLEKQNVDRAKRHFREFCNQNITDMKMKKMALDGVEYKQSYDDIVGFKHNMMKSVERATQYANEHIRQKDIELQAFINQIHHHLQTVIEELKQIPKKTKVKVDNDWKQIFSFTIPEWQEEDGKTRIRDHIEWILDQLDSNRFMNEKGEEDSGKVRKEVEMWLQSKQLIQIILNNEVMKVSCRKVTNDNKVTTRSYSWEQSNVWSGGEKWSKNMTLFLGILNYVAEKKQHIQPNMKRHRAVILDNPFGKASSDHVLSPVFFVAEQLGFQIIALTAHAEGKFLQDYFPIIYICRLRKSVDSTKKVITKEKWLHHAYFQDHEPKSMDRLGETEQLVLFE